MPTYRVEVTYDMGMSMGGETIQFEAKDDKAAQRWIKRNKGKDLSLIKRDVQFKEGTLSRVLSR